MGVLVVGKEELVDSKSRTVTVFGVATLFFVCQVIGQWSRIWICQIIQIVLYSMATSESERFCFLSFRAWVAVTEEYEMQVTQSLFAGSHLYICRNPWRH